MAGLQAGVVLSNVYTSEVQQQLQAAEEKSKKKGKRRLMGDGKAKLFSGDEFFALCVEDERQRKEDEAEAEQRKTLREAFAATLAAWKRNCDAIRERNKERKQRFEEAVIAWEEEKQVAKCEKRRPGWPQPKWKRDFNPEVLPERPKRSSEGEEEGSDDAADSEENDDINGT